MEAEELHHKIYQRGLVEAWARVAVEHLHTRMDKLKIGVTAQLRESLKYRLVRGANGMIDRVTFSFNLYGRYVDMGVGKGVSSGHLKEVRVYRRAIGLKGLGPNAHRRPKKWANKGFTAEFHRLQELMQESITNTITPSIRNVLSSTPILLN
ncbi:MAG: hypothetical protein ACEQSL_01740 [Sediminibacterium sp.]